ncbi:MAG: N-acetylmuramoyl-L-alanine amidase [Alphaproteobacteria bacterium]
MFGVLRRLAILMTAAVLGLAVPVDGGAEPIPPGAPEVTSLRIGDHGTRTRIVLDVSQEISHKIFTLAEPYRVVLDFNELAWNLSDKTGEAAGGMVSGLRFGLFTPGTSRLVLDLEKPVRVDRVFTLKPNGGYPYRFVVDLEQISQAAFMREAGSTILGGSDPPAVATSTPVPPRPLGIRPGDKARAENARPVIVIDAGHGGVDPGALGKGGTKEKYVTLAMAKELARQLDATGRYEVVLTRDADVFLRLRERVARARRANADLFVSLHADSHPKSSTRGLSVYTLSEKSSDREAARLAARENKADLIAGVDLSRETDDVTGILIDLAQRETMNNSARFAGFAVKELSKSVRLLNRTHRFAGFAVLKAPDVPSILVEMGYLSNPSEEKNLGSARYRAGIAEGLVRGIDSYFSWKTALNRS